MSRVLYAEEMAVRVPPQAKPYAFDEPDPDDRDLDDVKRDVLELRADFTNHVRNTAPAVALARVAKDTAAGRLKPPAPLDAFKPMDTGVERE